LPGDKEQDCGEDEDQQNLANQVGYEEHHLRELFRIGRNAADDTARLELVKEGHVVSYGSLKSVVPEGQHGIADDANREPAAEPAAQPVEESDAQDGTGQDQVRRDDQQVQSA
jgi:hypothetical protein